ncbi:MAG: alpha/beta hydrolase [Alkalispirochaetaceae bacterium]
MNRPPPSRRAPALFVLLPLAMLLIPGCSGGPEAQLSPGNRTLRELMQEELPPFEEAAPGKTPLVSEYYRDAYGEVAGASHAAGYMDAHGYRVALHLFSPRLASAGSLVVIHGYLAHTLQLAVLIEAALLEGYEVLAMELPGHALSRGERGEINEFRDYGLLLSSALDTAGARLPQPWHAAGHSTGAAAILIHLAELGDPFEEVVFLAPLIRSKYYGFSRFGRTLTRPFLSSLSTGYDDPLGVSRMPLAWFDAQVAWNRRNREYPGSQRSLLVLQGTGDTVVAWRRNRRYLERRFPNMEYHRLEGAGHVILREDPEILIPALGQILTHLEE